MLRCAVWCGQGVREGFSDGVRRGGAVAVVSASNEAIGLFVNSPVFQVNVGQGAAVASLPRELPPACAHFVDRSAERGLLEDACADSATTKVVVVDGIPGVGKSALVKKWGNEKLRRADLPRFRRLGRRRRLSGGRYAPIQAFPNDRPRCRVPYASFRSARPIPQLHLRQKHPRGFGERVQLCGDRALRSEFAVLARTRHKLENRYRFARNRDHPCFSRRTGRGRFARPFRPSCVRFVGRGGAASPSA